MGEETHPPQLRDSASEHSRPGTGVQVFVFAAVQVNGIILDWLEETEDLVSLICEVH